MNTTDKPNDHIWVKCPNGHNNAKHQHFDHCGVCAECGSNLIETASPTFNPLPQAEPDFARMPRTSFGSSFLFSRIGRLKPRTYLPGDPRAEWLHGWWAGIGVGAVIGAALMCMVLWVK